MFHYHHNNRDEMLKYGIRKRKALLKDLYGPAHFNAPLKNHSNSNSESKDNMKSLTLSDFLALKDNCYVSFHTGSLCLRLLSILISKNYRWDSGASSVYCYGYLKHNNQLHFMLVDSSTQLYYEVDPDKFYYNIEDKQFYFNGISYKEGPNLEVSLEAQKMWNDLGGGSAGRGADFSESLNNKLNQGKTSVHFVTLQFLEPSHYDIELKLKKSSNPNILKDFLGDHYSSSKCSSIYGFLSSDGGKLTFALEEQYGKDCHYINPRDFYYDCQEKKFVYSDRFQSSSKVSNHYDELQGFKKQIDADILAKPIDPLKTNINDDDEIKDQAGSNPGSVNLYNSDIPLKCGDKPPLRSLKDNDDLQSLKRYYDDSSQGKITVTECGYTVQNYILVYKLLETISKTVDSLWAISCPMLYSRYINVRLRFFASKETASAIQKGLAIIERLRGLKKDLVRDTKRIQDCRYSRKDIGTIVNQFNTYKISSSGAVLFNRNQVKEINGVVDNVQETIRKIQTIPEYIKSPEISLK